jgi:cytoskeletal protein CcmA (bactofilin family)
MAAAFVGATGHSHDGTDGNAPKIDLTTSVDGFLPAVHGGVGGKNKTDATTNPIVTNDNTQGYAPGSLWLNTSTGRVFLCVGNTTGAAVWREVAQITENNVFFPETNDSVDLGTTALRFRNLFLSGGLTMDGNVSIGGDVSVTGNSTFSGSITGNGTTTLGSVDINGGTIDATTVGNTTPAAGNFTTVDIDGGTIDGTTIGAVTPSTGVFSAVDINGGNIDGTAIGAASATTGTFTTLSATSLLNAAAVDINGGNIDNTIIGASTTAAANFTTVNTSGQANLNSVDINGGTIDGATIGASTPAGASFTAVSASTGFTGDLTGDVTGNVTGNVIGNITGNVAGDLTGDVTSSGTSTFSNVTISGSLNMDAATASTIVNLTNPTNAQDAATKAYVDSEISVLIDGAPGALDTLKELADALANDADAFSTLDNKINTKVSKAGDTMTGALAMGTNKITSSATPTVGSDLTNKTYVDAQRDTRVAKTGDSMSGNLEMSSNKVTGLAAPTNANDATRKAYVDDILGSATAAADSADAAAVSESNAATSEANALASENAAAISEQNAATSLDTFTDQYLGPKASEPATDNDGDPLAVGALYFNTTQSQMFVYTGNVWSAAAFDTNGALIAANNLADVADLQQARINIGVEDAEIFALAGI